MKEQEVLDILGKSGAVIKDSHVVYTSGRHGSAYINKDKVYPHTIDTSNLCVGIAEHFVEDNVEVVIAPAIGGVILSQWTAFHLTNMTEREVLGIYAEKDKNGILIVGREYDQFIPQKNILVVDDILTTGGSVKELVELVRSLGGNVIGVGILCNRGGIKPEDLADPPNLFALVNVTLESWPEEECPLCRDDVPINTDVGKGREFLASKKS